MVNFKWCDEEAEVLLFPVVAPKSRRWGWGKRLREAKFFFFVKIHAKIFSFCAETIKFGFI